MNSGNKHTHPTFLGIGAPRCGTTWLWKQLWLHHPQIWMPPLKEIHYFDHYHAQSSKDQHERERIKAFRRRVYRRHLRIRLQEYALLRFYNLNPKWDLNYFFRHRSDAWYQSIFIPKQGQIAGEITPSYAILDDAIIRHIYNLNPNLKLIFFMRDPIERIWSGTVAFTMGEKFRSTQSISEQELIARFQAPAVMRRSDYAAILSRWESVFPKKQFFFGFMEDIQTDPQGLLLRLFEFLGVDNSSSSIAESVQQKVGASKRHNKPIPPTIEKYLAQQYLPMIIELEKRFGPPINHWRKRAEAAISGG